MTIITVITDLSPLLSYLSTANFSKEDADMVSQLMNSEQKLTHLESINLTALWRADRTNSLWIWAFGLSLKFVDLATAMLFVIYFSYDNAIQILLST